MYIRYFIPEDGDDEKHPNVFKVNKDSNVTLADIKKAFPIPGSFHFRFQRVLESYIVWMDVTDDSATVPVHNNCITIKASRLSTGQALRAPRAQPVHSKATVEETEKKRNPSVKLINFDDGDSHSSAPAAQASSAAGEEDLLGFSTTSGSAPQPPATSSPANDPFGFNDFSSTPARTPSPMNPAPIAVPNGSTPMGQGSPMGGPMGSRPSPTMAAMSGGMTGGMGRGMAGMTGGMGSSMGGAMGGGMGGGMGMIQGRGGMPHPSQMNQQQKSNAGRNNSMGIDAFSGFK